jgi:hypothetical protein
VDERDVSCTTNQTDEHVKSNYRPATDFPPRIRRPTARARQVIVMEEVQTVYHLDVKVRAAQFRKKKNVIIKFFVSRVYLEALKKKSS